MKTIVRCDPSVNDTPARRRPHLMEFELEAQDVAQGLVLTHVRLDQRDEELVLVRTALVHFQNDVQHAVRVQVETSCGEKENAWRRSLFVKNARRDVICAKHSRVPTNPDWRTKPAPTRPIWSSVKWPTAHDDGRKHATETQRHVELLTATVACFFSSDYFWSLLL